MFFSTCFIGIHNCALPIHWSHFVQAKEAGPYLLFTDKRLLLHSHLKSINSEIISIFIYRRYTALSDKRCPQNWDSRMFPAQVRGGTGCNVLILLWRSRIFFVYDTSFSFWDICIHFVSFFFFQFCIWQIRNIKRPTCLWWILETISCCVLTSLIWTF